jgi:hypothetical protein
MSMRSSVRVIVRVRLAPWVDCQAFEWWLRAVPIVLSAVLVTGDVDYELQLDCRGFADLGDVLTRIRGYRGIEVDSTALVLHEVKGLGQRQCDEVTLRRLRNM